MRFRAKVYQASSGSLTGGGAVRCGFKSPGNDCVRKKWSNLAQKLKAPYRNVETVFLIERLFARLVADKKTQSAFGF